MTFLRKENIKLLFVVYTIAIVLAAGIAGLLVGKYQGALLLSDALREKAVLSDGILQQDDLFTLGDNNIYYLVDANIAMDQFQYVNASDILSDINSRR